VLGEKQAVHGTKKITRYHAQLTGWLYVCALVCSEEKILIHKTCSQDARNFENFSLQALLLFQP
jgi:hypothetical protein